MSDRPPVYISAADSMYMGLYSVAAPALRIHQVLARSWKYLAGPFIGAYLGVLHVALVQGRMSGHLTGHVPTGKRERLSTPLGAQAFPFKSLSFQFTSGFCELDIDR